MRPHPINRSNLLIGGYYIDDFKLCDEIIDWFNLETTEKSPGIFTDKKNSTGVVDETIKKSIDTTLNFNEKLYNRFIFHLVGGVKEYIKQYKYASGTCSFGDIESINVQYYPPGGGYYAWHTERLDPFHPIFSRRHLVFMLYLNDVENDGETEFLYQRVKVKPEKGLLLIWGADWAFTHRGITTQEEKYIVTGWLSNTTDDDLEERTSKNLVVVRNL